VLKNDGISANETTDVGNVRPEWNSELLRPSLQLGLHLAVGKYHARLKEGCTYHRILDLICGEFRWNNYVGNLDLCHGATSNQSGIV
jgi:hypothetical protein